MTAQLDHILPFNEVIPFSDGQSVELTRLVSDKGATAVVYEGSLQQSGSKNRVAVKAYRPFTDPIRRERESKILAQMMDLTPQMSTTLGLANYRPTPHYYGSGEFDNVSFIVMEYIDAVEILTASLENQISTADKISVIWQFCAFLEIIHDKRLCFKDFKSENLQWSASDRGGRLRILDLGDLIPEKSKTDNYYGTHKYDLLKASILLFKLLTGHGLRYSLNGLLEDIQPLLNKRFSLDWGTNRFLRQYLAGKIDQPELTAEMMRKDLQFLVTCWQSTDEDLYTDAVDRIRSAKELSQDEQRSLAIEARKMLGVASYRKNDVDENANINQAISQADKILYQRNHLLLGKQFLKEGLYKEALEQLDQGITLQSEDLTRLRRWRYVATIGLDLSPTSTDFRSNTLTFEQIINSMEEGRLTELFTTLDASIKDTSGYKALEDDYYLWKNLASAKDEEFERRYDNAKDYFIEAKRHLDKLPDAARVRQLEVGELETQISKMERFAATIEKAKYAVLEGKANLDKGDFEKAINFYKTAAQLAPDDRFVLDELRRAILSSIGSLELQSAQEFVEIGMMELAPDPTVLRYYQLVLELQLARHNLEKNKVDEFVSVLVDTYAVYQKDGAARDFVKSALTELSLSAEKQFESQKRVVDLRKLMHPIKLLEISDERITHLQKLVDELEFEQKSVLVKKINELLGQVAYLTRADQPDANGELARIYSPIHAQAYLQNRHLALEKAKDIIADARLLSNDLKYKENEIEQLSQSLDQMLEETVSQIGNISKTKSDELKNLKDKWAKVYSQICWYQTGPQELIFSDKDSIIASNLHLAISRFIIEIQEYLTKYDPDDNAALTLFREAFNKVNSLGLERLKALKLAIEEQIKTRESEIQEIENAFNLGDLAECSVSLNKWRHLEPGLLEWKIWEERIQQAKNFQAWQENHEVLTSTKKDSTTLQRIEEYAKLGLPDSHWKNGRAYAYLKQLDQHMKQTVQKATATPNSDDFRTAILEWVEIKAAMAHLPFNNTKENEEVPPSFVSIWRKKPGI